jgi:hypothetical protein
MSAAYACTPCMGGDEAAGQWCGEACLGAEGGTRHAWPAGNYLVQKLLDRCSESQRLEVGGALASCPWPVATEWTAAQRHTAQQPTLMAP